MYKQGKIYYFAATGFLYSLIIVDLYRKLVGTNVESIRNIVYVFFFSLLIIDMVKTKRLKPMLNIAIIVLIIFVFSIALNPGYPGVYTSSIILFISRLWPAYYIGRYTENWNRLSKSILWFSPIALIYAASLFIVPDIAGGQAYATIASNLAFVTLITLFASFHFRINIGFVISVFCLIPVFFYGTRAFFVGVVLSLFLYYLINSTQAGKYKRILLIVSFLIIVSIFLIFSDSIFQQLHNWFPESRTLNTIANGDFMNDSNRSSVFYDRIITHLLNKPFSILGLIGDRIYLSASNATTAEILSQFSHNCCLELCMNFGLPLGIILNVFFLRKLYIALKASFLNSTTMNYIYVLILGAGFVDMMLSASYMGSYIPWLLIGIAISINKLNKI